MEMERGNSGKDTAKQKKPYVKPQITQVPLRPEEAVLGFCKNAAVSGVMAATCSLGGCSIGGD